MQVIAHRGASKAEPENTIAAFERAHQLRADAVELDVRRTRDHVLVVHHDAVLPDGRVIVHTNFADLPSHVPTLGAALDACQPMWVNVEIKNDPNEPDFDPSDHIADATLDELSRRSEGDERWLISSFRRETIDRCHELRPSIRTAWLTIAVAPETATDLAASGHSAVHPWFGIVSREMIDAFHDVGLQVNTWTCDDPERMRELIEWGIDGICTNVPDVAVTFR